MKSWLKMKDLIDHEGFKAASEKRTRHACVSALKVAFPMGMQTKPLLMSLEPVLEFPGEGWKPEAALSVIVADDASAS